MCLCATLHIYIYIYPVEETESKSECLKVRRIRCCRVNGWTEFVLYLLHVSFGMKRAIQFYPAWWIGRHYIQRLGNDINAFGIYCLRSYIYYSHYIYNMLTNQHRLEKNPEDNENYSEHFYHQHSNLDIVLLEELSLSHSGQWPNRITCSNNRQWFTDNRHYISHATIRHHVATA